MKLMGALKRINYKHYICAGVLLLLALCSVFVYPHNVIRLLESIRDFGVSIAYYFLFIFRIRNDINPGITEYSNVSFYQNFSFGLPKTWAEFTVVWGDYWRLFASTENFYGYLRYIGMLLYNVFILFLIGLLIFLVLFMLLKLDMSRNNNDYGKESKPLKVFKTVTKYAYLPVRNWVKAFFEFLRDYKAWYVSWIVVLLINHNLISIVISFFAYVFYFAVSFDVVSLYTQVYKLFLDLSVGLCNVPWWCIALVLVLLVNHLFKKIGYKRLNHHEMKNRGFINSLPVVVMNCGTMGSNKTTLLTDMALSQEVMYLDKARDLMLEHTLKFPNFPWIDLENLLKDAVDRHEIYSLATCRVFVNKLYREEHPFSYDVERYGSIFDNKLQHVDIWESITSYAQLYFLYTLKTSFLIFNYSVRTDNVMLDKGNFPIWNTNFFYRDSADVDEEARYAHVLDFDALRLGSKIKNNNPNSNFFEFGVVGITEIGKERGNALENQDKKKTDEKVNQKNDKFDSWLKMIRHSATVDYQCFARVFSDEQRPESLGADARELCEILGLRDKSEIKLARPGFFLVDLFYDFVYSRFASVFFSYRYNRGDTTLLYYLFRSLTANIFKYYTGVYNTFGYRTVTIDMRRGLYDNPEETKYYLSNKKIYSKRFSTDCFSDFFAVKALRSSVGLDDIETYGDVKATFQELASQNSYFVNDLIKGLLK